VLALFGAPLLAAIRSAGKRTGGGHGA
jgi:hypothetical protein